MEEIGQKINTNQEFEGENALKRLFSKGKLRILVAPLDWGLGHTTRCFPIIRQLIQAGHEVWLAGNKSQKILFEFEFPSIQVLSLNGYGIRYSAKKRGLKWRVLFQLPKLRKNIRYEHRWLKETQEKNNFDLVISDNRYGLYHSSLPSIFITHQLKIKNPLGKWAENWLQKINYRFINRFSECWVPDFENKNQLAGELSHPQLLPAIAVRYLGSLTRFQKKNIPVIKDHLLIIISGPEPQRSIFEKKIIKDIAHYKGTATLVRGLPSNESIIPSTNMLKFHNHLPSADLENEMATAEFVISRSGYSTIMDLVTMQKKSILIPTPGQTEQEYLGKFLMEKRIVFSMNQNEFTLNQALEEASIFDYNLPAIDNNTDFNQLVIAFMAKSKM